MGRTSSNAMASHAENRIRLTRPHIPYNDELVPFRSSDVAIAVLVLPTRRCRQGQHRVFTLRLRGFQLRVCFLPHFPEAPRSERMLLPKRAAAFWEGHKKPSALFQKICWEEPGKQKPRRCRAQGLARSSGQGNAWHEKGRLPDSTNIGIFNPIGRMRFEKIGLEIG